MKIPKSEILWKTDNTPNGTFLTTSDKIRSKYTLWRQEENGVTKIKSAATPNQFNEVLEPYWNPPSDDKPKRNRKGK